MEGQFKQILQGQAPAFETGQVSGFVASYAYRMDADPKDYYLAVVFENRETYWALARSRISVMVTLAIAMADLPNWTYI
jgi:hypothetical protein